MTVYDFKTMLTTLDKISYLNNKVIIVEGENTEPYEAILKELNIPEGDWNEFRRGRYSNHIYLLDKKNDKDFPFELDENFYAHYGMKVSVIDN